MSTPTIRSLPFTAAGRDNYDRIFRKTDPAHALTPGTIREYRSACCGAEVAVRGIHSDHWCRRCGQTCQSILTKIR